MPTPANLGRPFMERVSRIHALLKSNRHEQWNCTTIAAELEVSSKTVLRDITFMRDRLGYPIEFDRNQRRNTYYYSGSFEAKAGLNLQSSTHPIALRFCARAACEIRRRYWHATQRIEEQPNGVLTIYLSVHATNDLVSWILGWGDQVKVISPRSLALRVARKGAAIARLYSC